ncbi:MAG: hypothetical protein Fues2KO_52230 [Fuerstiella sp.]
MKSVVTTVAFWLVTLASANAAEPPLTIPAGTAYFEPDKGVQILKSADTDSEEAGPPDAGPPDAGPPVRWQDERTTINWFGQFRTTGRLQAAVRLTPKSPIAGRTFQLSIGEQTESVVVPQQSDAADEPTTLTFGDYDIASTGYLPIRLQVATTSPDGSTPNTEVFDVVLHSLQLEGAATKDARFNLKPRRNAASVHLFYPVSDQQKVAAFYCKMTALEDPLWSYYMACGWHRGYFGMQVNSPTERRIIFSVWDSGNEAIDRNKVAAENRVRLVAKGDDVYAGDFGNEGTGGHSHLKFQWKTGVPQHFVVTARPVDDSHTIYAGYYLHPERQEWMLISSWNAPFEGGYLRGLYSFSENFVGRNGHLRRKALYGDQWIRSSDGNWHELTTAKFSHDGTGRSDRLDRFMGLEDNQFFLSHGGFVNGFTKYGQTFNRPATGQRPIVLDLPGLPFESGTSP